MNNNSILDSNSILRNLQVVGVSSSIFLSGIWFSCSQLAVPLLYPLRPSLSSSAFAKFYYSGRAIIVPIIITGTLTLTGAAYLHPQKRTQHATAASLTIMTLPWTMLMMESLNHHIIGLSENEGTEAENLGMEGMKELLKQWRDMNFIRAVMTGVGGLLSLAALVF